MAEEIQKTEGNPAKYVIDIEDQTYIECVRQLYGHAIGNRIRTILVTVFVGSTLWVAKIDAQILTIWAIVSVIANIGVATLDYRFSSAEKNIENSKKFGDYRVLIGGIAALPFGIAPFLVEPSSNLTIELLLFIILSTTVSVSSIGFSSFPPMYLAVNFATMALLTLSYLRQIDIPHLSMVFFGLVWQYTVLRKALLTSKTVVEGIRTNERLTQEINEHTATKAKLAHMAYHDPLTEIANRRLFGEFAENKIQIAKRNNDKFAILLVDLDKFKPINDTHGHDSGDKVLQEVAKRLKAIFREGDIVARVGGDEFAALASNISSFEEANQLVGRLKDSLNQPITIIGKTLFIGASVGVSIYPDGGNELEAMMLHADREMYKDKSS